MSKRAWLIGLGVPAAAALVVAVGVDRHLASQANFDDLGQRHGVAILHNLAPLNTATRWGMIAATAPSRWEVAAYANILREELGKYPADLTKYIRLRRIVLVRDLMFAGQLRAAVPDWHENVLYLDVSRGRHNRAYQRRVFHHEWFHLIDYWDDGQLYRDAGWSALNPPDFRYQSGGVNLQNDARASVYSADRPGFLNRYCMQGVEEDKAEVFAYLMVEPRLMHWRAENDKIVAAKVVEMKRLLQSFCPAFQFTE
jgi:hypothetical protein